MGHGGYPMTQSDALEGPAVFPEPPGAATGVTSDWEDGRLSFISWPRQQAWPHATGDQPTEAPRLTLADIAEGTWDAQILAWAQKLREWGQPVYLRLMWEFNGGDPPWAIDHEWDFGSPDPSTWETNWLKAWQRIYLIFKGSDADVATLTSGFFPGSTPYALNGGHSADARNVLFVWGGQEYETAGSHGATQNRDSGYPGDAYVDAAATELYLSPGHTAEQMLTNTGGAGWGGITHKPFYSEYADNRDKIITPGEGGTRWKTGETTTAVDRVNSYIPAFEARPQVKVFLWWDGGSPSGAGQSALGDPKPAVVQNAEKAFFNDPYMMPELTVTYAPHAWSEEPTQGRAPVGHAKTNYGPGQLGAILLRRTATSDTMAAAT